MLTGKKHAGTVDAERQNLKHKAVSGSHSPSLELINQAVLQ